MKQTGESFNLSCSPMSWTQLNWQRPIQILMVQVLTSRLFQSPLDTDHSTNPSTLQPFHTHQAAFPTSPVRFRTSAGSPSTSHKPTTGASEGTRLPSHVSPSRCQAPRSDYPAEVSRSASGRCCTQICAGWKKSKKARDLDILKRDREELQARIAKLNPRQ